MFFLKFSGKEGRKILFVWCIAACLVGCGGKKSANELPTANAGDDVTVASQYIVNLTGSGIDPDGTIVAYRWTRIAGPEVIIQDEDRSNANFFAPEVSKQEELTLELKVTDSDGAFDTDRINVSIVPSADVFLYQAGLGGRMGNKGRWYNYIQSEEPCLSGVGFPISSLSPASCFNWLTDQGGPRENWIESIGPWWIDPNHHQGTELNGFGYINVLGFSQIPGALTAPVNMQNSIVGFSARKSADFSTIYADSSLGYLKSQIYLWFQTAARSIDDCSPNPKIGENCTRQSDYILTANPIDDLLGEAEETISLAILGKNADEWTCLGAGTNVKYECEDFHTAIQKVETIGFIAGPVATCPINNVTGLCNIDVDVRDFYNTGTFEFRSFSIASGFVRSNILYEIGFSEVAEQEPAEGWQPIQYAMPENFESGSGLHAKVNSVNGYTRLGLSTNNSHYLFSTVGFQIYLTAENQNMLVVEMAEDSSFTIIKAVSRYELNDTVGLYMKDDKMLVLRNDEIVYSTQLPCNSCSLYPFISSLGASNDNVTVYRH